MSQGWRWCYLVTNAMASCMSCRVPTMDPLMIVIVVVVVADGRRR